jgi:hypothetical protein
VYIFNSQGLEEAVVRRSIEISLLLEAIICAHERGIALTVIYSLYKYTAGEGSAFTPFSRFFQDTPAINIII